MSLNSRPRVIKKRGYAPFDLDTVLISEFRRYGRPPYVLSTCGSTFCQLWVLMAGLRVHKTDIFFVRNHKFAFEGSVVEEIRAPLKFSLDQICDPPDKKLRL